MYTGIRPAGRGDIPALCEIWEACFRDSDDYVRLFYRENFDRIDVPVYAVDGKPVSALHLLDASFEDGGGSRRAKLIYAVGTLPGYRRRGFMGSLLNSVKARAKTDGHALFLKPSSRYMTDYYRRYGFEPDACLRLMTVLPGEKIPLSVSPLTPEAYNRMRDAAFCARPYVKWSDAHLRWCVADNEWYGGRTLSVEFDAERFFMMGAVDGDALVITETDMSPDRLGRAAGTLCDLFGASSLRAYLPDHVCPEAERILSSVVFNAPLRGTYVNLILI